MENAIRHNKTPEERKAALEEALRRVRPVVLGHNEPVGKRLEQFANRPIDEQTKTSDRKKALKPLSLAEMAKKGTELEKKAEKAGIDLKGPGLAKDIDEKNKEKKKEKEKDKEKELTPEKQEQKMKEMFSKVRLPSGMEIHQEGPSWVLVSKDGKQRTDVTDVMNTIDKFNRNVDAANEENRMQNNVQNSADRAVDASQKDLMKNDGLQINEISGKATMIGDALLMVKDIDGNQVFKPEDVKAIAEAALAISDEKMKLERLADPKALEQMKKREKDNEDKAEARRKAMMLYNQRHNGRGGREPTA